MRRDGATVLAWSDEKNRIVEPAELAGVTLDKLRPWIESLPPGRRESARLLQWGAIIAQRTQPIVGSTVRCQRPGGRPLLHVSGAPRRRRRTHRRHPRFQSGHNTVVSEVRMKMNDMVIISVDDHISEPPTMFDKHLSGKALETAPKLRTTEKGTNYWDYQGVEDPVRRSERGRRTRAGGIRHGTDGSLDSCARGFYDVQRAHRRHERQRHRRIAQLRQLPSDSTAAYSTRCRTRRRRSRTCAPTTTGTSTSGAASYPGRFIPCAILPDLGPEAAMVEELKRVARKGCTAVSINENPTDSGPAEHPQRLLGTAVEGGDRRGHDHLPAHRRRQSGAARVAWKRRSRPGSAPCRCPSPSARPTGCISRRSSAIRR